MVEDKWWKRAAKTHSAIPELAEQLRKGEIGRRDFLRTATLLGLSATAAYALAGKMTGAHFVPRAMAQAGKRGGNLRVSMFVKEITDPAIFDWSEKGNVARQFVDPIVRISPDNIATPHLAESWQASEDLKTWTFKLRQDIKWSNGDDFGADDIIFNFTRWIDPDTGSSNENRFSALKEPPEKIDDHSVRFNLERPELAMPESMGDYPALIVHRRFSDEGGDLSKNPVGTGAFELVEFNVGERAVLRRRADQHWTGEVYLDQITYIDLGGDASAEINAFVSGQVDLSHLTSVEQVLAIRQIPGLNLNETATAQTGVVRMRLTEEPWGNAKLRQAVLAAIDNQRLLEIAYQGLGLPGEDHHVAPVHPAYADLPDKKQDYDLARRLLAEAGHANGIEFDVQCVDSPEWEQNTTIAIAEMLRPAGITANVNVLPGKTYWDRWDKWPFSLTSWTHRALATQVLNLGYRKGGVWNETAYANPEFDRLLDQAGGTVDVNERRKVMAKLEKLMQDDAIIIQPYWRSIFTTSTDKVRNYNVQPALEQHLNQVWLDA